MTSSSYRPGLTCFSMVHISGKHLLVREKCYRKYAEPIPEFVECGLDTDIVRPTREHQQRKCSSNRRLQSLFASPLASEQAGKQHRQRVRRPKYQNMSHTQPPTSRRMRDPQNGLEPDAMKSANCFCQHLNATSQWRIDDYLQVTGQVCN
jgi:hypothetical protein